MLTSGAASMRSRNAAAGRGPIRNSTNRWTSATTRFVVRSRIRRATAARSIRSACGCRSSLALAAANQALLSTNARPLVLSARGILRCTFGDVGFVQVAIEILGYVRRQAVQHADQPEDR